MVDDDIMMFGQAADDDPEDAGMMNDYCLLVHERPMLVA
jgi:hypothetical protein